MRELDSNSNHLQSDVLQIAADALHTEPEQITNITVLKKGMTNRSFLFECGGSRHIMRIPGEGTDQLINRREEAQVYHVIQDKHLCDDIEYINPENGYKITKFFNHARVCNPNDQNDVQKCMNRLRQFHDAGMQDPHVDIAMFAIYSLYNKEQIDELIGMYFTEGCNKETRFKIYCYIAAGGLLWSNWCEYKRNLGVDFGEYSLRQYRYAKDYYKIFMEETNEGR